MRSATRFALGMALGAALVVGDSSALAQGKKPGGGGGGGTTNYKYALIDLLGFPGWAVQSQGQFVTNRDDAGEVLIGGNSHLYLDLAVPVLLYPALWNVRADGTFPDTDPVNLGLPSSSREVEVTGINRAGFVVARSRWSNTQDADGNWIFPSYVNWAGLGYVELPGSANRTTEAQAINDAGTIVGALSVTTDDPKYPRGIKGEGAVWQVNLNGSVSQPLLLGEFYPADINSYGVMAGTTSDGYPAIGWLDGTTLSLKRMDPSLRFFGADIVAINDYPAGDARLAVVGNSWRNEAGQGDAADSHRGVVWRPYNAARPTTVLGTLGGNEGTVFDVNRAEQIVGWSITKRGDQHAFVYSNGTMTDLNAVTAVGARNLQFAMGINDDGDIVGFMHIPRPVSEQHGFLLRPITP
jgi:probable HAF family extracellular repeat protein